MEQPAPRRMTVAEFVEWDDGTETRYELVDGSPVAMNPPMGRHVRIATNVFRALIANLRRPCQPFMGGGVAQAYDSKTYRIPDIFVSCAGGTEHFFDQPRLVVEILSPSTEKEDRSTKLDFYKGFPSIEAVLFVWQDLRRVELHERQDGDAWVVRNFIGGEVPLASFGFALSVDELYADL